MIPRLKNHSIVGNGLVSGYVDDYTFPIVIGISNYDPKMGNLVCARFGHQDGIAGFHERMFSTALKLSNSSSTTEISAGVFCPAAKMSLYEIGVALPFGSCHSGRVCKKSTIFHLFQ